MALAYRRQVWRLPPSGTFAARFRAARSATADSIEDEREQVREAARQALSHLDKHLTLILDEHSGSTRWLTASLLAINGGATLAVFNATDRLSRVALDAAPFAAGTLAALAVAVLNQRANRGAAAILGQAIGRTGAIAITGDYDDKDAKFEQELAPRLNAVGRWPARVGWVSAALFAIGTVITGTDHPPVDRSNAARCEALQGDMLSAQPLRRDSPELFRALGCKPQGDGSVHAHLSAERILGLQED